MLALAVAGIVLAWSRNTADDVPAGFARSNGRIEAERVDIAAKLPGRLKDVLVKEGDTVEAGQVLARLDTAEL
ncbi:biotin/lipoyl-binding protein, partial [Acinetobacter baumannii]